MPIQFCNVDVDLSVLFAHIFRSDRCVAVNPRRVPTHQGNLGKILTFSNVAWVTQNHYMCTRHVTNGRVLASDVLNFFLQTRWLTMFHP